MNGITFDSLITNVYRWAENKGIDKADDWRPQMGKVDEEIAEYKDELYNSTVLENNTIDEMLEMGDIFVTLIIQCKQRGYQPDTCLNMAYNKIKNRQGKTINGTFVKAGDY